MYLKTLGYFFTDEIHIRIDKTGLSHSPVRKKVKFMAYKKVEKLFYTMESSLKTIAIKCYAEQLGLPSDATPQQIIRKLKEVIPNIDSTKYQVFAICHYRDTNKDNIWHPSTEKAHVHIWARVKGKNAIKLRSWLNLLHVTYRECVDDDLFRNHGVESCRHFDVCAMYSTHDTDDAIADGKAHYELEEVIMNMSMDEFKNIRAGYISGLSGSGKVDLKTRTELSSVAFKMGYELKGWTAFYSILSEAQKECSAGMKVWKEEYKLGTTARYTENKYVNRLSIYIQGKAGIGKSFYSDSLPGVLAVDGGDTGKFDDLTEAHKGISISDYHTKNLLNLADNKMCHVYKRNKDNPLFCGDLFVVTGNDSFEDWVIQCNGGHKPTNFDAYESRFYVCHVDAEGKLICDHPSKRGTEAEQQDRLNRFLDFKKGFEASLKEYAEIKKSSAPVDYSAILEETDVKEKTDIEKECLERENTELKEQVKEAEKRIIEAHDDVAKELLSLPLVDIVFLQQNGYSEAMPFMPSGEGKTLKYEIV